MPATRVAVVTGANKGVGLAIVKELCAKFEGDVYLTSRNEDLGKAAVAELEKLGLHPRYHQLDIDDESSVIRLRDYLNSTYGGLDILVNNAAILLWPNSYKTLHEKAAKTLETNFFNTKRACDILFPILRPHARVVNVSSAAGLLMLVPGQELKNKIASPDLTCNDLCSLMHDYIEALRNGDYVEKGWPNTPICIYPPEYQKILNQMKEDEDGKGDKNRFDAPLSDYEVSKIGICALTRIQQRQFQQDSERPDIIVNSVHPGYVDTDMTRHTGFNTIEQGAVAPTWLALLPPDVDGPKGEFVWHDKSIGDWVNGPIHSDYAIIADNLLEAHQE